MVGGRTTTGTWFCSSMGAQDQRSRCRPTWTWSARRIRRWSHDFNIDPIKVLVDGNRVLSPGHDVGRRQRHRGRRSSGAVDLRRHQAGTAGAGVHRGGGNRPARCDGVQRRSAAVEAADQPGQRGPRRAHCRVCRRSHGGGPPPLEAGSRRPRAGPGGSWSSPGFRAATAAWTSTRAEPTRSRSCWGS